MVPIGVDAHKQIHMAVAVAATGAILGTWCGPNSRAGWEEMLQWASSLADDRQWGIEGAWNYGRGLAQQLVDRGETVFDINPRWTAVRRRSARKVDKSDTRDAHAIAKVVQEERATLPQVTAEDESAVLDLLVTEREAALAEATRLRNQLHQLLLQLDPEYKQHLPTLTSKAGVQAIAAYQPMGQRELDHVRAAAVRRLAARLQLVVEQTKELARQIRVRVEPRYASLADLCGIGLLTAGALVGILGPGQRFTSDAQVAALAGVAPLEASSAGRVRHRLNRGGNRRLNAILYRMAQTQSRCLPAAQQYLDRRQAEGKTRRVPYGRSGSSTEALPHSRHMAAVEGVPARATSSDSKRCLSDRALRTVISRRELGQGRVSAAQRRALRQPATADKLKPAGQAALMLICPLT